VFSIPFSATAVLTHGSGADAFGLQAAIFLGSLWLARELLAAVLGRTFRPSSVPFALYLLAAFLAIACLSLVMPLLINGHLLIRDAQTTAFYPLTLMGHEFTQMMYLVYGVAFAAAVALRSLHADWRRSTVTAYIAGGLVLAGWGWLQFILSVSGLEYPRGILNTSTHAAAQGFTETLSLPIGQVQRISSAALEPSLFAQVELTVVALLLVMIGNGHTIISRRADLAALVGITSITLLSTSSTAYVGFAFLVLVLSLSVISDTKRRRTYLTGLLAAVSVATLLYVIAPVVHDVLNSSVFSKTSTWSANVRWSAVKDAWWQFTAYPVLGTGWGTAPNDDLVVFMLASTGVLGLLAFSFLVAYMATELRTRKKLQSSPGDREFALATAVATALLTVLFTNLLTGFAFVFGHVWLLLGLGIACGAVLRTRETPGIRASGPKPLETSSSRDAVSVADSREEPRLSC
jgi:hypothetical protein